MSPALRIFCDSNVLFSACTGSPNCEPIWSLNFLQVQTSQYSIDEVSRNLKRPELRARLWKFVERSTLVIGWETIVLPAEMSLAKKDVPIMQAAIAARADILITGDRHHFGPYTGRLIAGVLLESPAIFRLRYPDHFDFRNANRWP